jgi:hypothetical protein
LRGFGATAGSNQAVIVDGIKINESTSVARVWPASTSSRSNASK